MFCETTNYRNQTRLCARLLVISFNRLDIRSVLVCACVCLYRLCKIPMSDQRAAIQSASTPSSSFSISTYGQAFRIAVLTLARSRARARLHTPPCGIFRQNICVSTHMLMVHNVRMELTASHKSRNLINTHIRGAMR